TDIRALFRSATGGAGRPYRAAITTGRAAAPTRSEVPDQVRVARPKLASCRERDRKAKQAKDRHLRAALCLSATGRARGPVRALGATGRAGEGPDQRGNAGDGRWQEIATVQTLA